MSEVQIAQEWWAKPFYPPPLEVTLILDARNFPCKLNGPTFSSFIGILRAESRRCNKFALSPQLEMTRMPCPGPRRRRPELWASQLFRWGRRAAEEHQVVALESIREVRRDRRHP